VGSKTAASGVWAMSDITEIPEADVVEEQSTDVVPAAAGAVIFKTEDPMEIMQRTAAVATALRQFVKDQGLVSQISGRDYMLVEGWQMLGMMLGVTPGKVTSRPVEHGWEGLVELHDRNGRVVGSGDAECLETEKTWGKRDDYARKSMAQTRAVGKAFRNTFGFIAKAAGFEATPAEEMPSQAEQAPVEAGPKYGPAVSDAQLATTRRALGYLMDCEPDQDPVGVVLDEIKRRAGGYLPHFALAALVVTAQEAKKRREALDWERAEALAVEHEEVSAGA
jgi:hypothetical protein